MSVPTQCLNGHKEDVLCLDARDDLLASGSEVFQPVLLLITLFLAGPHCANLGFENQEIY